MTKNKINTLLLASASILSTCSTQEEDILVEDEKDIVIDENSSVVEKKEEISIKKEEAPFIMIDKNVSKHMMNGSPIFYLGVMPYNFKGLDATKFEPLNNGHFIFGAGLPVASVLDGGIIIEGGLQFEIAKKDIVNVDKARPSYNSEISGKNVGEVINQAKTLGEASFNAILTILNDANTKTAIKNLRKIRANADATQEEKDSAVKAVNNVKYNIIRYLETKENEVLPGKAALYDVAVAKDSVDNNDNDVSVNILRKIFNKANHDKSVEKAGDEGNAVNSQSPVNTSVADGKDFYKVGTFASSKDSLLSFTENLINQSDCEKLLNDYVSDLSTPGMSDQAMFNNLDKTHTKIAPIVKDAFEVNGQADLSEIKQYMPFVKDLALQAKQAVGSSQDKKERSEKIKEFFEKDSISFNQVKSDATITGYTKPAKRKKQLLEQQLNNPASNVAPAQSQVDTANASVNDNADDLIKEDEFNSYKNNIGADVIPNQQIQAKTRFGVTLLTSAGVSAHCPFVIQGQYNAIATASVRAGGDIFTTNEEFLKFGEGRVIGEFSIKFAVNQDHNIYVGPGLALDGDFIRLQLRGMFLNSGKEENNKQQQEDDLDDLDF